MTINHIDKDLNQKVRLIYTTPNCDIGGTCNPSSGCTPALYTPPPDIYGDVNNDGIVDENDIHALEELLGSCRGDLNFDGIVNVHDILMTIGNWGACE